MYNIRTKKILQKTLLYSPIAITLILWMFAKIDENAFQLTLAPTYVSQIIALVSINLLASTYLIAGRFVFLEKIIGGLDKTYKIHSQFGKLAFVFIVLHPILIALNNIGDFTLVQTLFIPFHPAGSLAKTLGILSLYLYIYLILITIFKVLPYHLWKISHKFLGIPFLLGGAHGILAASDVAKYTPLRYWMLLWIAVGLFSYIYKLVLYKYIGPKYLYKVKSHRKLESEDIYEILMEPTDRKINFEPGQFVFLQVKDHPVLKSEEHPFSISSPPSKNTLRVSYKALGDYTEKMSDNLQIGDKIEVFGPYGEFTSYNYTKHKRQIWIAGGIGVTPFISMLEYEAFNEDEKEVYFFYCTKNKHKAGYTDEVIEFMNKADDNFHFGVCNTSKSGRLTAKQVHETVGELQDYVILLCGPLAMMQDLKTQFEKLGVSSSNIVFEEFNFLG